MIDPTSTDDRELPGEAESWHRLHELIDRITPEIAEVPGYFEEGWTAKDAVAHIGTWMAAGAQVLRQGGPALITISDKKYDVSALVGNLF